MIRVYVASSWRNEVQKLVVDKLHKPDSGIVVYDFKNPATSKGFQWSEIDSRWKGWNFQQYKKALEHPLAESGFDSDMMALRWCDACVLVLPCGKSAHLELGWACGAGKKTAIYHPPQHQTEPELMNKMVNLQTNSIRLLNHWLMDLVDNSKRSYVDWK